MEQFSVFIVIINCSLVLSTTVQWYEKKYDHQLRRSLDNDVRHFAMLSDEFGFNETLTPIAIPRVPGTKGHDAVRDFIKSEMESLQWTVKLDSFVDRTPLGPMPFTNIIGTQDENTPRHLVLACHYDSKMDREKALVLITDSAVPCAMLIHLAKQLHTNLLLPRENLNDISLQFIFFDGEEAFERWTEYDSLYGSRHLAESMERKRYPRGAMTNHLDRMDVLVLLDLLGSPNPTFYNYFDDTKDLFLTMLNMENALHNMGLLVEHPRNYFINEVIFGGIEDDHVPFLKRGVRVVHLIPQPFPNVWHQETDVIENLHFPTIENLNKILRVFVADYLHLSTMTSTLSPTETVGNSDRSSSL